MLEMLYAQRLTSNSYVRLWACFLLSFLANARKTVYCPLAAQQIEPRFNVLCSLAKPCHNVDIYCPSNAYTDFLWVNCNGPHACVNVSIYTSKSTNVVCRGRRGACENVDFYCGDVTSLTEGTLINNNDNNNDNTLHAITCKFRHLAPHVTENSFFGCYGKEVKECKSTSVADDAYSNSHMHCDISSDSPCTMRCLTSDSCKNNEMECTSTNQTNCQCYPSSNCAEVAVKAETTQADPEVDDSICYYVPMKTNDYLDSMILAADYCNTIHEGETEESFKVTCKAAGEETGVVQYFSDANCMEPMDVNTENYPCIVTSSVRNSPVASITRYSMKGVDACMGDDAIMAYADEKSTYYLSVGDCAAHGEEENVWHQYSCNDGVLVHSSYGANDCNDQSLISSDSFFDGGCHVEVHESEIETQFLQINCNVRGDTPAAEDENPVSYKDSVGTNDGKLEDWQLALAILLPSLFVILLCVAIAYIVPRWRKWGNFSDNGPLVDADNQSIPQQTIAPETTTTPTINNTSVSAQSTDAAVNQTESAPLNTAVEGDKV